MLNEQHRRNLLLEHCQAALGPSTFGPWLLGKWLASLGLWQRQDVELSSCGPGLETVRDTLSAQHYRRRRRTHNYRVFCPMGPSGPLPATTTSPWCVVSLSRKTTRRAAEHYSYRSVLVCLVVDGAVSLAQSNDRHTGVMQRLASRWRPRAS
jgi:hypothetical protein